MIATVYCRREISCAHRLLLPYDSKCSALHGHNYIVEVWITGEIDETTGMVLDYSIINRVVDELDHKSLNSIIKQPTAENIAKYLCSSLVNEYKLNRDEKPNKVRVRVWEDRDSYAEVEV